MQERGVLFTRLAGLILLSIASIANSSFYHVSLFLVSLLLNSAFAFRRSFPASVTAVNFSIVYIILHLALQFINQIPFIGDHLHDAFRSAFGLARLFCFSGGREETCETPFWSAYVGCFAEVALVALLAWNRTKVAVMRVEYTSEAERSHWRHVYLLAPVSIIAWALLFPSWLSFVWLLASWLIFSLIGERRHRLSVAPFLIAYASFLLMIQHVSALFSFEGRTLEKVGIHSSAGAAAFYPLVCKQVFIVPFYVMRYLDGGELDAASSTQPPRDAIASEGTRFAWITPFICLFACILYVCFFYLYSLIYGEWRMLASGEWLSHVAGSLAVALWLPILFIIVLIFVHMKRWGSSVEFPWRPSGALNRAVAAHCDTLISVLLCLFASLNVSVIGFVLLLLSFVIFAASPKICMAASCTASILLAFLWLLSFVSSALMLPRLEFPAHCERAFVLDYNVSQWLGFSPEQTWPVILLLFVMSMRCAFTFDRKQWLSEIKRSDAEKDISSMMKFVLKFWMHKFGVEISLIYGVVLATSHHDVFGLFLLLSICTLRMLSRRQQAIFWPMYARLVLAVVVFEYLSALGAPLQFSKCFDMFWNDFPPSVRSYFMLSSSVTSAPIVIADFVFTLLLFTQKDVFQRQGDHPGGDNTPLSELLPHHTIPTMYKDFISTKGCLVAYVHSAVFLYGHWVTLVVVLICSIEGGSVLAFGYIIAVFLLLWKGTELYATQPFHKFLKTWSYLVYYNVVIIAIKLLYLNSLCDFGLSLPCWLESLLRLRCGLSFCADNKGTSTLLYEVICFTVLVFQMRVFNSWYFQHVVMDYRADRILGSRGAELLLEMKEREGRKNERRLHCNVNWIEMVVAEEDREMPSSCGHPPRSHEEIKRSGYYHQMSERFFPKWLGNLEGDGEHERSLSSALSEPSEVPESVSNESTMVEKTVEVLDSVRVTVLHLVQLINNPEWLFQISKGHAYIAHVLENDKRQIKAILKHRLLVCDSCEKLELLKSELALRGDFHSIVSSEALWNEALDEWRSLHSAFKVIYCISHTVMAQSELVCFIFMLFVHLSKSSLISLPLPLMVFCWGALCIPRPPRLFWIVCAFYMQFIIVFRLLFQNEMIPEWLTQSTTDKDNPFSVARLLGLSPSVDGTYWDVAALSMLFMHRYKLLRLGMWGDDYHVRERRTHLDDDSHVESDRETVPSGNAHFLACEPFLLALLTKKAPSSMDWYPWMVACDALCLILISMFYSMIGQGGSGNVLLDVQASRLPRWFAYTLPVVFLIMIIDRWLYLAKRIAFRLAFYLSLVFLLHIAIFFFVPSITGRSVTWNGAAIALYLIKSAYLFMSAWHIRNGYPSVINQNILEKNYGIARLLVLKIYLNIPFLFELRTAMDWTFTSTSLTMGDFIRLENYFNEVVAQNCWIQFDHWFDNYFPTRKGRPTPTAGKFFKGVLSVFALIIIILAPILLFAFLNSFGTRVPPENLRVTAEIEGYPVLYEMQALHDHMSYISVTNLEELSGKLYEKEDNEIRRSAFSFLSEYSNVDVFLAHLEADSLKDWGISRPAKQRLTKQLLTTENIRLVFNLDLERQHGSAQRTHRLSIAAPLSSEQASSLVEMIDGRLAMANFTLPLPRFLLAPPYGDLSPAAAMNMALKTAQSKSSWQYKEGTFWSVRLEEELIIFVDRVVPSWMSNVVGSGGMVAMYVAVVLVVGRFVREIVRTPLSNAMIEDLPNADNLLRLFQDIYVVREKRHFYLESRLYGKLLFLVRSPETVIRWSRYRVKVKES